MTAVRKPADRPPIVMRFTVAQYHTMIENRILDEGQPYELLNGVIVRKDRSVRGEDPMTVGYAHATAVTKLAELGAKLIRLGCHIRVQQPIAIPPRHEPEPDAAVVVGTSTDYQRRHPGPSDVLCVVEVADASLQIDRTIKLEIYAKAGISCYLIVNLIDRAIEVYGDPDRRTGRYRERSTVARAGRVRIPTARGRALTVRVKQIIS